MVLADFLKGIIIWLQAKEDSNLSLEQLINVYFFYCQNYEEKKMRKLVKRDGRKVPFDERKIYVAIDKAFNACGLENDELIETVFDSVLAKIDATYKSKKLPSVEEVQDLIEKSLIENNAAEVAKAFILYRAERTRIRDANTSLMRTLHDLTFTEAAESDTKRENANIDGDTAMGTMLKYGSESVKEFYVNQVIGKKFATAHKNGDIHIHDMDFYTLTMTCCQIDLLKLFEGGFSTGHGFLREPNSIRAYGSLAAIAIQANQNDQHGGQSIPNFDYAMAPGVKKSYRKAIVSNLVKLYLFEDIEVSKADIKYLVSQAEVKAGEFGLEAPKFDAALLVELNDRFPSLPNEKVLKTALKYAYSEVDDETLQSMEAFIHNLNTMHSRAGAQVPFSSLNYGTDTSPEGRMVMRRLLDATERGLGNGETPIFPIQIFKVKEGINYNPGDPNYDLFQQSIRVSGKRLFPNFSFIDAPFNKQYYKPGDWRSEATYMGCRTRVIGNVDKEQEIVNGRGNLSFTSINLPRIAIEHHDSISSFYKRLDELLELVKDQLLERLEIQARKRVYNFPFLMGQGIWLDSDKLGPEDEVRPVLAHGTLTIGFIGLAEALVALTGKHHGESAESQKLGLEIIGHMRAKCDEYMEKYHLNFSLIGTPAEGLSGRFVRLDKKKYGIIAGVTDQDFYTNSFHVPVYYPISMYDKINIEAPYHAFTNGGHITYVEVDGDVSKNPEAFETIIRTMHDAGIGYGAVNHPVDRDPICGFNGIIDNVCPCCGRTEGQIRFERIRRITGYLVGTTDRFNNAKRAELDHRVKHLTGASLHTN